MINAKLLFNLKTYKQNFAKQHPNAVPFIKKVFKNAQVGSKLCLTVKNKDEQQQELEITLTKSDIEMIKNFI